MPGPIPDTPPPPAETRRLQALRDLDLLDTAPEEGFDRITRMAARIFDVPVALIGLVDAQRVWFKSRIGMAAHEADRAHALYAHVLAQDDALVVDDAGADARFEAHPEVASGTVGFFAGMPLAAPDGSKVGILYLADDAPRAFGDDERALLRDLADLAVREIAAHATRGEHAHEQAWQRDADACLHAVLDVVPEGVLLLDCSATVVAANPAAAALFGMPSERLAGRALQSLAVESLAGLPPGRANGAAQERACTGRRPDGSDFPLQLRISALLPDGRHHVVIVRDASPQLEQAWRERAAGTRRHETFSLAAHELRTPLASILGFSELLLKRDFDASTARELLEIVHTQATTLSTVMNQVFDLARIEAGGRQALRLAPESVSGVLTEALGILAPEGRNGRVVLALDPGLPPLAADARRLARAFAEVIGNGLRYDDAGGLVTVRAWHDALAHPDKVTVQVTDHGPGMTAHDLERLFHPFHRGVAARGKPGTGLGMAIVQEIVDAHQGEIAVATHPGKGTEISLYLPAAGEAAHG